jgi:hypothetical protein
MIWLNRAMQFKLASLAAAIIRSLKYLSRDVDTAI